MRRLILINEHPAALATMTLDEKIRYGMLALTGASFVFAALGLKLGPLEIVGGWGTG
jgi:hypothetical protein